MTQKKTKRKKKQTKHSPKAIPNPACESQVVDPQEVDAEPQQQAVQNKQEALADISDKRMTCSEKLNILILCGLLIVNVIVLWFMREDAKLEKRAWIGLENPTIKPIKAGEPTSYELIFVNTGKTPAVDARQNSRIVCGINEKAILEWFNRNPFTSDAGKAPLAPNAKISVSHASTDTVTESLFASIDSGRAVMFVLVKIEYRDIFDDRHKTHACLAYEPTTHKLIAYHKYNYMD